MGLAAAASGAGPTYRGANATCDAVGFADRLAERAVYVMPGTLFERPRHFRISLTASPEMVERALPAFRDAADGKAGDWGRAEDRRRPVRRPEQRQR
jgi:aspartate/methionine/tyrosine aminotransferase